MNLISFTDFDTTNPAAVKEFVDLNAMAHETIYNTLTGTLGITIEHYPLFSGDDDQNWAFVHDKEHKAISDALNLGLPPDLSTVNWKDVEESSDWLQDHYLMHQQIAQILGI